MGSVSCGPTVKNVTTNSSIDSVTLMSAPARMDGQMSGRMMCRTVRRLSAPRSAAAHSRLRSKPCRLAATMRMTKGTVNTRCPATTVSSDSCMSSTRRRKMRMAIPSSIPGSMMGSVAMTRAAPGKRMPPRTSGEGGHRADDGGERRPRSPRRRSSSRPRPAGRGWRAPCSYQSRVSPVMGRPGVRGSLNEKHHQQHDGQVQEGHHQRRPAATARVVSGARSGLTGIDSSGSILLSHGRPRPPPGDAAGRSPGARSRRRR